jgi:hypothetical protein
MMKYLYIIFSILFLVYLVIPGPTSINDFSALPNSDQSKLSGDTWQMPKVVAFFSNNYRDFATNFYRRQYQEKTSFPFLPRRLNHPPELAFTAIKDQTHSTYLEEFYYPFRDSLYVNGLEPFENGQPRYNGAVKFEQDGVLWDTKVTLRYYPSSLVNRLIVWIGVVVSLYFLGKLSKRIIFNV